MLFRVSNLEVIDAPQDLKFIKTPKMGELPKPEVGGSIEQFRKYLNINDADWPLVQGLLVAMYMPEGPYPLGAFIGPQGSAKSTNQTLALWLCDPRPNLEMARDRLPRDERSLVVLAKQNRVLSFDNVSRIPDWLSDAFATLSTGGNTTERRLYTDDDVLNFSQKRMVLVNGIGDIITRPDLLDRSIIIECPSLQSYDSEKAIFARFSQERPKILGALFEMVHKASQHYAEIAVDDSVRMADFLRWAVASEIPDFEKAYNMNRKRAWYIAIENSPVGRFIKSIADNFEGAVYESDADQLAKASLTPEMANGRWIGTYSGLYERGSLEAISDFDWPRKFESFVNQVQRLLPALNSIGITIEKHRNDPFEWILVGYKKGAKNATG